MKRNTAKRNTAESLKMIISLRLTAPLPFFHNRVRQCLRLFIFLLTNLKLSIEILLNRLKRIISLRLPNFLLLPKVLLAFNFYIHNLS